MPQEYWILFLISFMTSWLTTPLFRRLALALRITDQPSARKVHTEPIPYLGGLAFHAAVTAGLVALLFVMPHVLLNNEVKYQLLLLYAVASAFQLMGVLDDVFSLPAPIKLVWQTLLTLVLVSNGFVIDQISNPFGGVIPLGWLGVVLSVLWILTIVNAINFIDGLDGLAAGIVFFAAFANLVIALYPWQNFICLVSILLMGCTLGFLPYNFSPARIFMGDAGSLYLGVLLGGSALVSNVKGATVMSLALPLVILFIPLLDTMLTVIRRGSRGLHLFTADREHIHHRLLRLGYTDRQVVLFVYGICLLLAFSAILAAQLPTQYSILFIFVFLAAVFMGLLVFNNIENRLVVREKVESTNPPELLGSQPERKDHHHSP